MITVLLEKIIQILEGWITAFTSHAQHVEDKLDSIDSTASDIEINTDPIPDIRDNTAAIITPIQNIKSNTDSIATSSQTSANNTTAILNNISTLSTNTGRAAAFAEDCANNTLEIKDKITTIASDTTQLRADSAELNDMSDKIYEAIKWSLIDKYIDETEEGASPFSFDTDIADDLQLLEVGLVAHQSGSGDPAPDNVRPITGYSTMGLTINGSSVSIALGDTYYNGYLDVISGKLVIDMVKDSISSSYLSGLSSSYFGYVSSVTALNNHPAIWIRNWKYPPNAKGFVQGGIKSKCNAFIVSMNNSSIIATQYRIYFDVNNLNITSTSDFITTVQNLESNNNTLDIIYELETPITINLTAQQIAAISGVNTITTDTNGNIKVTYKESIKHYLDKQDNA